MKKKKSKIKLIIFFIILIVGGVGYYFYRSNNPTKKVKEIKTLDKIDKYGYVLDDNDSKLYKSEYKNLKNILNEKEVDEKKYACQVGKMFIIDLYSLNTKTNMYDVGGVEFFYSAKKEMYEKKVMDTLYSNIIDNTYGDRKQDLPEVSSINLITCDEDVYKLKEEEIKAYKASYEWSYNKNSGYDNKGIIYLIKDGIKWSVFEYNPE